MPFTQVNTLEPNPFVRIFFIGLNILAPAANETCQTFVHRETRDHHLLIEVRRKRPGKPDLIVMRRNGPLTPVDADPTETHGFLIEAQGLSPAQRGVKGYNGTRPSNEGTSLFDAFTLANDILDVPPGEVDDGGLPSILIDHGVFYTADTQMRNAIFRKKSGGEKRRGETPTIIAANIYRPARAVQLIWQEDDEDVHLTLEPSANFTHEIYIINEPFFDPESPDSPKHDEFEKYFEILPDVPDHEQFTLELAELPDSERGTTRNPCMSILLSD
jgi:hypothetical protein